MKMMITFVVLRETMTFPKCAITTSFYFSLVKKYMFFPLMVLVENNNKFYTCGCLFDCYAYLFYGHESAFFSVIGIFFSE